MRESFTVGFLYLGEREECRIPGVGNGVHIVLSVSSVCVLGGNSYTGTRLDSG